MNAFMQQNRVLLNKIVNMGLKNPEHTLTLDRKQITATIPYIL